MESIRMLGRRGLCGGGGDGDGADAAGRTDAAVAAGAADAVQRYELSPPGSFALCADPSFDAYATRELARLVEVATHAVARFEPLGVILTGSLARGEGVLVRERERRTRWLSDIECLVVLPDRGGLCGALGEALARAVAALQAETASRAIGLNIQLSPILSSRLMRIRRAIFSCELAAHGKLLWGRPDIIAMPELKPGHLPALRADAFRLLNNRIMEQVALRTSDEEGKAAASQRGYGLSKFWTELATSLSVFLGCYRTTYQERQLAMEAALAAADNPLDRETADDLRPGLDAAMRVRRGELDASRWPQDAGYARAGRLAERVWQWESARMLAERDPGDAGDWRAIPRRLRRVATLSQCGRDWARWCLRPDVSRRMGLRAVLPALRSGSPGNAIYAAGCLLDFFWDDIGAQRGPGPDIARMLGAMFALSGAARGSLTRRQLAGRAVAAWRSHLRSAAL
jgi:hypothetical protein